MKDSEKKVAEIIAGLGSMNLDKAKILSFLASPEGQKLASSLGGNSSAISGVLQNMSNDDISAKLRQVDLSKLSDSGINDLLKKLR